MHCTKRAWMLVTLVAGAVALAGCAEVEETIAPEPRYISIDDRLYECDDTLSADGVCEEYIAAEPDDVVVDAEVEAETRADGTVAVGDRVYVCDDTFGVEVSVPAECDEWRLLDA